MPFPYYKTDEGRLDQLPPDLTLSPISQADKNRTYIAHQDLADAVNVAALLGQPLLLTGEPGTGKTQLAYSVNWKLGFVNPAPFSFETKSTSMAKDLFYTYDALGRFHAAQTAEKNKSVDNPASYITYNALGLAILLANPWETARRFLPFGDEVKSAETQLEELKKLRQFEFLKDATVDNWQRRSVVLIDEIDKAPRDFPNDILNEIDNMFFRVPELNEEIQVPEKDYQHRPVVILTSNSEKNLPDAFLRRCAYYHIDFPNKTQLREIVVTRLFPEELPVEPRKDWLDDALGLFEQIRRQNLIKNPATAELIGWLTAIRSEKFGEQFKEFQNLPTKEKRSFINLTLSILTKNENDRKRVGNMQELKLL